MEEGKKKQGIKGDDTWIVCARTTTTDKYKTKIAEMKTISGAGMIAIKLYILRGAGGGGYVMFMRIVVFLGIHLFLHQNQHPSEKSANQVLKVRHRVECYLPAGIEWNITWSRI